MERSDSPTSTTLELIGHSLLSNPDVYTDGALNADGELAVVGTRHANGSFLVDLSDPTAPAERHHLPATDDSGFNNLDVKFDPRPGLYYRTREPRDGVGGEGDVEIVDFGYGEGTPEDPEIVGRVDSPYSHNLCPHPERPFVYVVNHDDGIERGLGVWDVSDPGRPERVAEAWPHGSLHDVVVDAERDFLHCAGTSAYALLNISDPRSPTELGGINYNARPDYAEIGEPGFEGGHLAVPDPERDLVVMGDEVTSGVPGGKHVIDIGWDDGSPSNPTPIGFTHSPNAQIQDEATVCLWTTHNHDVVPHDDGTLLVSGDYCEGVVLYDVTDPRDPVPIDRYPTDDKLEEVGNPGPAPFAWSATYSPERDLIFASDMRTGAYTFELSSDPG